MGTEFVVLRALAIWEDALGRLVTGTTFRDPVSCVKKDGWTSYAVIESFFDNPRELGHRGVLQTHFVLDGGLWGYQTRRQRQASSLWYAEHPDAAEDMELLELLEWPTSVWCVLHIAHNSVEWGIKWLLVNWKDDLSDLHIIVESVRNSWDDVIKHVDDLIAVIEFVDPPERPDGNKEFWEVLGFTEKEVEFLTSLNLMWGPQRGKLLVSRLHEHDPEIYVKVQSMILLAFRIKEFSDTRWVAIAESLQGLVAALSVGLAFVIRCVINDPDASHKFIGGFTRLTSRLRHTVFVGSCYLIFDI